MRRELFSWLLLFSLFSTVHDRVTAAISVTVGPDDDGRLTIFVHGAGETVTLAGVQALLSGSDATLLQNVGGGVWYLRANLLVETDTRLDITAASGVTELRLRSDGDGFVYLRTTDGTLHIEGTAVHSWDEAAQNVDATYSDGRAYILARGNAILNIIDAEISYLGWSDSESYGVAWRDVNDPGQPGILRSRVTGAVLNSQFHHNYYGVYTHQASFMLFRGNAFYDNVRYGFDPHDYTHDVLVEENVAYGNGSHGFIISRGCFNFTIRDNISYDNYDPGANLAHGFMLDPGAPTSSMPPSPSVNNVITANEAYGNEGYGIRVRGSHDNHISENDFHDNYQGIVLDTESHDNVVADNLVTNNGRNGIYLRESAHENEVGGNTSENNGEHGIYIKSNQNLITNNVSRGNVKGGVTILPATGSTEAVVDNELRGNLVEANGRDGFEIHRAQDSLFAANTSRGNGRHGFYLTDGSTLNQLRGNTIYGNNEHGIRANELATRRNSWSQNGVYGNGFGGIALTSGANDGVMPPLLTAVQDGILEGTAVPGAAVEIFTDDGFQARYYEGQTVADGDGRFVFTTTAWQAGWVTAVVTDAAGNSSVLADHLPAPVPPRRIFLPIVKSS